MATLYIKDDKNKWVPIPGTVGPKGDPGVPGPQGEPGKGVLPGGTAGQVLTKVSDNDYDTEWKDATGGSKIWTGSVVDYEENKDYIDENYDIVVIESIKVPETFSTAEIYVDAQPQDVQDGSAHMLQVYLTQKGFFGHEPDNHCLVIQGTGESKQIVGLQLKQLFEDDTVTIFNTNWAEDDPRILDRLNV